MTFACTVALIKVRLQDLKLRNLVFINHYEKRHLHFYIACFLLIKEVNESCQNMDNGAKDEIGDNCKSWYDRHPEDCGKYDDVDFKAKNMCCACKTVGNIYGRKYQHHDFN